MTQFQVFEQNIELYLRCGHYSGVRNYWCMACTYSTYLFFFFNFNCLIIPYSDRTRRLVNKHKIIPKWDLDRFRKMKWEEKSTADAQKWKGTIECRRRRHHLWFGQMINNSGVQQQQSSRRIPQWHQGRSWFIAKVLIDLRVTWWLYVYAVAMWQCGILLFAFYSSVI